MRWNVTTAMMIFLLLLGLSGCGGGGNENAARTPPAISNLQYTPASATVNTPTNVNWGFDFTDESGDISTATYTIFNPNGDQVAEVTLNLTIPAGIKAGTEHITTNNITLVSVGTYTAKIFVKDSAGTRSNTLTATFTVTP